MTDLPPGWTRARLGDVIDRIDAGKSFGIASGPAEAGQWGIVRVSSMTWGEFRPSENKAVPPGIAINTGHTICCGDILLSRANTEEYVGASVRVREPVERLLLSDKSLRITPSGAIDPELLFQLLQSPTVRHQISSLATGTKDSMRNISQASLKSVEIPLPPVGEQLRVADRILDLARALDRADDHLRNAQRRAAQLQAGRLRQLLSSYEDSHAETTPLSGIALSVRNGIYVSRPSVEPDGIPILRINSVRPYSLDISESRYSRKSNDDLVAIGALLGPGDLLFTRYSGNAEYVGACAVVPYEVGPLTYPDKLIRVQLDATRADPSFVAITCNFGKARDLIRRARKTTAGQIGISGTSLKAVTINLPPLSIQHLISQSVDDILSDNCRLIADIERQRARLRSLRTAVLDAAFRGELVDQDPTEEPADVLLARIRAERKAAAVPAKTTRNLRTRKANAQ